MTYTKKLTNALSLHTIDHHTIILDDIDRRLVDFAAYTAIRLGISGPTFTRFLDGTITEADLHQEMRTSLLSEEGGSAKPQATRPYDINNGWGDSSSGNQKFGNSYKKRLDALEQQRQAVADEQFTSNRQDRESRLKHERDVTNPTGFVADQIKDHSERLVKHILKTPKGQRGPKVKEIVGKLIAAANKLLYDPKKHTNGDQAKWVLAPKHRPRTGTQTVGARTEGVITQATTNQALLEEIVISELFGTLKRALGSLFNREKDDQDDEKPVQTIDYKHLANPVDFAISNIIDVLRSADISTHSQTNMLQSVIKYITTHTGVNFKSTSDDRQTQIIDDYVQKILKHQQDRPNKNFTISTANLDNHKASKVINQYRDALDKRGYNVEVKQSPRAKTVEFIVTQKTKSANQSAGDQQTNQQTNQQTEVWGSGKQADGDSTDDGLGHTNNSKEVERSPYEIDDASEKKGPRSSDFNLMPGGSSDQMKIAAQQRGIALIAKYGDSLAVGMDRSSQFWAYNPKTGWYKFMGDPEKLKAALVKNYQDGVVTPFSEVSQKFLDKLATGPTNNPQEQPGTYEQLELGKRSTDKPRVVGFLIKDGEERRKMKVAISGATAYVYHKDEWHELPLPVLKKLWTGTNVKGFELQRTGTAKQTDNHPLPMAPGRARSKKTQQVDGQPSMLNR